MVCIWESSACASLIELSITYPDAENILLLRCLVVMKAVREVGMVPLF